MGTRPHAGSHPTCLSENIVNSSTEATNDAELIQSITDGNSGAFTTLYDRHATLLFSVAYHILSDREEARDIVQQVFIKVLKKSSLYSAAKGKAGAWLCTMTRNQSLDRVRQMKSKRLLNENLHEVAASEHDHAWQNQRYAQFSDEVELLNGALAALRPEEIHVLHLAYFGGLSQTEIASKLDQPLGSVKARIRRSLVKLRAALDGMLNPVMAKAHHETVYMAAR